MAEYRVSLNLLFVREVDPLREAASACVAAEWALLRHNARKTA